MKNYVRYEDFGAVGDGVNNDFFAMKAAHEFANRNGLPVKADASRKYLISNTEKDGVASSIVVMTDTDFSGATVIFDDTDIAWREGEHKCHDTDIFRIESRHSAKAVEKKYVDRINGIGGIRRETTRKIDTGLGFPAMLVIKNDEKLVYIRFLGNRRAGGR